ncbi:MAG: LysM peptidoglycan-binding domain-containing protein [Myxococcota bacterium]|nr:LysM peptidoglycan-binding domain-containing protein [Myxococcota bacterium]
MRTLKNAHLHLLSLGFLMVCSVAHGQRIRLAGPTGSEIPTEYLVEKGDTLWDICDHYFSEPQRWPSIWALNPHVTNPHWIYPGDILRLRHPGQLGSDGVANKPFSYTVGSEGTRQVTINEGFIVDAPVESVGQLSYSPHTQQYLALDDLVYLELTDLPAARSGQRFSVYVVEHDVVHPESQDVLGQKIRIKGVVEIETVDRHMARAKIIASYGEIERGMSLMAEQKHHRVVNPRQNLIDLKGMVVDALSPSKELAQFDTIFIDRGKKQGVQVGNRFFVMRRGDGKFEYKLKVNKKMPWEQIGEALVVVARDNTATALITRSAVEVRRGDRVIMQRHY